MNFWYMIFIIWATLTVIWAIIFIFIAKIWFGPKFAYLKDPLIKQNLLYEGFARNDY